jgi:ubiquinone/menaquinone biosynthesis C-methylase UbiE
MEFTQRMFDRRGRRYNAIARRIARRLYRGVAAEVAASGLPTGAGVLDIGTGPGRLLWELAAIRPDLRLTGIDLSASMISVAQQQLSALSVEVPVRLDVGDGAEMRYPDRSFDMILSTASMHHWQAPGRVVADAFRVLRPGGRFWVYDISLMRFTAFATAVETTFGTPPARTIHRLGPFGLPLIARLASTRQD